MAQQSEAAFAPALSPGSSLVPPAPPAAGYQSPELKPWNAAAAAAMGNNGVFPAPAAPAAPPAPSGLYNNMSITVSMAGGGAGIGPVPAGIPGIGSMMAAGMNSVCSEQVPDAALRPPGLYCNQLGSGELLKAEPDGAQVQQVQVFADVQCTVNVLGGGEPFLSPPKNPPGPPPAPKSLLQQLLTE